MPRQSYSFIRIHIPFHVCLLAVMCKTISCPVCVLSSFSFLLLLVCWFRCNILWMPKMCVFLCEDRHGCWQKGWCEDFNYWNIERVFFFLLNKTLYSFKFVKWAIGRICRKVYPLNILGNPFLQLHICFISLAVCNSWTAFNAKNMQNSVFPHRKNKGG